MDTSLCYFDGAFSRCNGKSWQEQKDCKYAERNPKNNRCESCKNDQYEYLCDHREAQDEARRNFQSKE